MPERPRLHLDFNSPCTPPPIYSPYFQSTSSPYSPPLASSTPTRRSSTSSTSTSSLDSPRTPSTPKIIMGAMVFTPEPKSIFGRNGNGESEEEEEEAEASLEVPGIVLTEPPRQPSPRLPSPPPKQVVLLAPCSLPIPTSSITSSSSNSNIVIPLRDSKTPLSFSSYTDDRGKPQFSTTFMKFLGYPEHHHQQAQSSRNKSKKSLKMILILAIMILGCWHLWSTFEFGLSVGVGLIEETSLVL